MRLQSFVQVKEDSHFPLENLPFGIFSIRNEPQLRWRAGSAIGDYVIDLAELEKEDFFASAGISGQIFSQDSLNEFMSLGRMSWRKVREILTELLITDNPRIRDDAELRKRVLIPMGEVQMGLPARIGDYTDFFVSKYHTENCNEIFRGYRKINDNWYQLPVGYHGRASSIVVSGTEVRRPRGQYLGEDGQPEQGACKKLDFELEMACLIGPGNNQGESIPVEGAEDHIFGLVIMNDWSARDIQKWEAVPLGPFNGKNFATSISPWVVTLDALEPFRCEAPPRDRPVLPYLHMDRPPSYNIELRVDIAPKERPSEPRTVSKSNFRHLYWTLPQFVAHHSRGGCNLRPGDMMGTGTISGQDAGSYGCMLELSWGGSKDVPVGDGLSRRFLEDGDTVVLSGFCQGDGFRVGFGECRGLVLPAREE
uniref:Fumarylacetoacetase n=1 Tax=Tetraselmis sp. GSL018 TaxID=582737 RepID=A0A061QNF4_9CHLO|mmetsp:Transcript_8708/g.21001  ORF Transcript_8708/g.21001 Transcript_8708/m.21001 type:complete len:423 (+) Transcript_8708:189-1457(+)